MASYVTVAQFLQRKDVRDIGDLVSDDSTQVPASNLPSNQNLLTAIADASGDVEASLLVGGRYTTEDLEGLTGNAANYLQRITTEIAMYYLIVRRPDVDNERLEFYDKLRGRYLSTLASGENIFGLDDTIAATKADVDGPTTETYNNLNLMADEARPGYYPVRRLPFNR